MPSARQQSKVQGQHSPASRLPSPAQKASTGPSWRWRCAPGHSQTPKCVPSRSGLIHGGLSRCSAFGPEFSTIRRRYTPPPCFPTLSALVPAWSSHPRRRTSYEACTSCFLAYYRKKVSRQVRWDLTRPRTTLMADPPATDGGPRDELVP